MAFTSMRYNDRLPQFVQTKSQKVRNQPALVYEMVDVVEPDQPYHDEIDGDDVVQQARHDQDQNSGDKGGERRYVTDGKNHCKLLG
jgi:hypothetical protein